MKAFQAAGADLISITGGLCGFVLPDHTEPGYFKELSRLALQSVTIPVLLTGGVTKPEEAEAEARGILKKLGLESKADAYPYQLSGGQQQRAAIARALILRPRVLFFDEPTSALDPELTGEVLKVIRQLAKEKTTMVIVTHEMLFARDVSDRIIFMDNGTVVENCTPEELFASKNQRTQEFLGKYLNPET